MTPNEQRALDYANEVKTWTTAHTTVTIGIVMFVAGFLTKWIFF